MGSRQRNSDALVRSARIVKAYGRVYLSKGKYPTLRVYTPSVRNARMLKSIFGGNYYPHGSGYRWIVSSKEDLARVNVLVNGIEELR